MKLKFKKIIIFSSISIFTAMLALVYFFVLPKIINIEKYKPEIRKYIKENVSMPLELGKFDLAMTWNLGVKIKLDDAFLKKNDGSKFITIGNSDIEVSLLPLINKHVVIREVVINYPDVNITRDENGTFDVAKIYVPKGKAKYKVELKDTSINLNNYKINFIDKYISPKKDLVLNGQNLKIKDFTPDKHIEIQADGKAFNEMPSLKLFSGNDRIFKKVSDCGREMTFNLFLNADFPLNKKSPTQNILKARGDIVNFDLNELKPYVNKYSFRKFADFTGTGNVNFDIDLNKEIHGKRKFFIDSTTNNLNIKDALKGSILSHKGQLMFLTSGNFDDKDLYLEDFQVNGDKINSEIRGKISNFANRKIRNVDLSIDISDTRAKIAAEIFPKSIKVPLDPFNKILKYNVDGNVSGSLRAKGYYRRPELFGKIKFDDFSVIEKIYGTPNGYGSVEFLGPMLVIDSTQYIGKDQFVKTTGSVVPFKGKKVKLSINSTQNVDFGKTLPVLLAVRDIFQFKLTPVTEMDIKGFGKANLDIEGASGDATITGYVDAKNATVKYKTLADQAENVNGRVKFTGTKVYYDELRGSVDGIQVIPTGYSSLHGYSDVKLYMPKLDLKKGQKFVYASPLLYKAQFALKDILDIKGFADSTIFIKGTEAKTLSNGIFKFANGYVNYKGYGAPFNNLKGGLRYDNESVFLDTINGNALGNNVTVNGSVKALTKDIDMTITSKNIKLEDAKKFVMNSTLLDKTQKIVKDFSNIKGTSAIKLVLKGKADGDCLKSLVFSNTDATFEQKQVGFPIKIHQGTLNITDDDVQTNGIQASAANTDFTLKGKVSNLKANLKTKAPVIPDLELKIRKFDVSTLKEVLKTPIIPVKVKKYLTKIAQSSGFADVSVHMKPSGFKADVDFDNFAMIYQPLQSEKSYREELLYYDLPVLIKTGKAEITDKNMFLSNINAKISNSDFFINGSIKNYTNKPSFEIMSSLEFNPEDANRLSSLLKQIVAIKNPIPVSVKIKGNTDNWNVQAKMALNKGTSIGYAKQIGLPDDKVRMLTLDAKGENDRIDIKSLNLDLCEKDNELSYKSPWDFDVIGEKDNLLSFSGSIDKLKTIKPVFRNFKIYTNNDKPLSICILNSGANTVIHNGNEKFFSEGNFQADLTMNGYIFSPNIDGTISFSGLKIPDYKLNLGNANISFSKDAIDVNLKDLKIDDSPMNVKATIDYPLDTPLMVRDMEITSNYINMDKIGKVFVANKDMVSNNNGDIKTPMFVIKNGTLDSKELILRDLITADAKASLSFTPDWLLSLSDIEMKAAGGSGTANLYYNAKSTELSLNLIAKNMQANAITTTLLAFPNEVYGTLNGEGQFYTRGRNSQEMISNSNGYANFKINQGRLVRLGSMEYLLRAANVIQSGIGGFNVNNIIDLVVPQKTGYFDKLEGKFDIKDGVINTDEITSSGDNLSLYISGNFDMLTNNADAKVIGRLSQKVAGLLGPIGSVSINQFIGYVPGIGFLPATPEEKGLIDLIPGLSKIPVLGLGCKQKNRQFVVDINGNLYEQSSVKSFRWLD